MIRTRSAMALSGYGSETGNVVPFSATDFDVPLHNVWKQQPLAIDERPAIVAMGVFSRPYRRSIEPQIPKGDKRCTCPFHTCNSCAFGT